MKTETVIFSNKYGTVEITPLTDLMPVSSIHKTHPSAVLNTFDLYDAEKIALITENRKIQICPHFFPLTGRAYLILHDSPSIAAICSVKITKFTAYKSPGELIRELNQTERFNHEN